MVDLDALRESLVRREATFDKPIPDFLPSDYGRLEEMAAAADEIEECYRVLSRGGSNIVAEVLRGQGKFVEWSHYPKGDIYDNGSHAQYYYHAHRNEEHGHFHTFIRAKGMPKGVTSVPMPPPIKCAVGDKALCHIVAISMDKMGFPFRLFTTNQWVTGETWYNSADTVRMIDSFNIDHAVPSWPTNRWVGAMMRLFRPQIQWLLRGRDDAIEIWRKAHPDTLVYNDRGLDVPSVVDISVERQAKRVREALNRA